MARLGAIQLRDVQGDITTSLRAIHLESRQFQEIPDTPCAL